METQGELLFTHALGSFRPDAPGDQPRPGHAGLARLEPEREEPPERELRPRGDGTVHARRRQLHGEGHPGGGPGLHRLAHRPAAGSRSSTASTTTARRRSSARRATGTATTSCASCSSSPAVPTFLCPQAVPVPRQRERHAAERVPGAARGRVPQERLRHRRSRANDPALASTSTRHTPIARR